MTASTDPLNHASETSPPGGQAAAAESPPNPAAETPVAEGALPYESQLLRTMFRLFFIGASVAAGILLALLVENKETLAIANELRPSRRTTIMGLTLAGGGLSCLIGTIYLARRPRGVGLERLTRAAMILSPLMVAFAIPNLFDWIAFEHRDFMFVILATLFTLALERLLVTSLRAAAETRLESWWQRVLARIRWHQKVPTVLVWMMAVAFGAYMSFYAIRQHYQLMTYSWDMGIFNNIMFNLLRGHWFKASPVLGPTGSHIQFHATFGAYLFLPFYSLWQKPESMLIMQATLAGFAAVPYYLLARHRLGSAWAGLVFAYAYLLHAPLHGPLFYDFHFFTTGPFWVGWVIYLFETNRKGWLIVAWVAAVSMREEISAGLAMASLFYLMMGKRTGWAFFGGLMSGAYFLIVKFIIMPLHGPDTGESFSWIFQGLIPPGEVGFGGVLRTLATSPVFSFSKVFTEEKFTYVLKTLAPFLLLPIRNRMAWILCIPAVMFTLLSTGYPPLVQTKFQYTNNWTPYVVLGSIFVLDEWRKQEPGGFRYRAAVLALIMSATLFSYNGGAILQRNSFESGFQKVNFDWTKAHQKQKDELYALIKLIPDQASVSACENIVPHVSSRENAFTLNRSGVLDADYILCDTGLLKQQPTSDLVHGALATGNYGFVKKSGNFAMWKKGGDHKKDAAGKKLLAASPEERAEQQEKLKQRSQRPPAPAPSASGSAAASPSASAPVPSASASASAPPPTMHAARPGP